MKHSFVTAYLLLILNLCFQVVHSTSGVTKSSNATVRAIMPRADPATNNDLGASPVVKAVASTGSDNVRLMLVHFS